MKLTPEQLEISKEKITEYLLLFKPKHDKSKFLNTLGYNLDNWEALAIAIVQLASSNELVFQSSSPFGTLFSVKGNLKSYQVVSIWILKVSSDKYQFVTLYPA